MGALIILREFGTKLENVVLDNATFYNSFLFYCLITYQLYKFGLIKQLGGWTHDFDVMVQKHLWHNLGQTRH